MRNASRIRKQTILRVIRIYDEIVRLEAAHRAQRPRVGPRLMCIRAAHHRSDIAVIAKPFDSTTMQRPLTQRILFRVHWVAGITAGLVLAVVGFTGALINVENATLDLINPAFHAGAPDGAKAKSLASLVDAARAANPGYDARSIAWNGDDRAASVRLGHGKERGGIEVGVGEDDVGVLAAQFQGYLLDGRGCGGGDPLPGFQPAREGDEVDVGVFGQRCTNLGAGSGEEDIVDMLE